MICSKCGNNCNDGDVLCSNCGYSLVQNSNNQLYNNTVPNNGQYQNMNNNYNMLNNGQYQNMNNNYPNRKVKSSAGVVVAIVVIGIVVLIVGVILVALPLIKSLVKSTGLRGEWYCSERMSSVNQEEASAHIYLNYDDTFKWAKNGDENNNYYSGDFKVTDVEIKTGDETYSNYQIEMTTKEGIIDGISSNQFNNVPKEFIVMVTRNKTDDKVHAVFTANSGSSVWNCIKKED